MKYKLPVSWTMIADVVITADSFEEAIRKAEVMDLPDRSEYCDGSFAVNRELIEQAPKIYGKIR